MQTKKEIIDAYKKSENDTGSAEVQIALLTEKINELTEHLKANPKDFGGRRGLLMMVGHRKSLLSYLKDKDLTGYRELLKKLSLRG